MSALSSSDRGDVDRRVGDDEDLVIGRHVHDEHVADAACRCAARFRGQQPRREARPCASFLSSTARPRPCARAPRPWPPPRDCAARRRSWPTRVRCRPFARSPGSCSPGRPESATMRPFSPASIAPASAVSSQGCAIAVGTGGRLRHRSSTCSYFPVPVDAVMVVAFVSKKLCGNRRGRLSQGRVSHARLAASKVRALSQPCIPAAGATW